VSIGNFGAELFGYILLFLWLVQPASKNSNRLFWFVLIDQHTFDKLLNVGFVGKDRRDRFEKLIHSAQVLVKLNPDTV